MYVVCKLGKLDKKKYELQQTLEIYREKSFRKIKDPSESISFPVVHFHARDLLDVEWRTSIVVV